MNKILIRITFAFALIITACSNSAKETKGELGDKKVTLEKLKAEKVKLDGDIKKLEEELSKLDPASQKDRARLVAAMPVTQEFYTLHRTAGKGGCQRYSDCNSKRNALAGKRNLCEKG
jgi:membrane fusion protein, multidrug efflux system